MTGLIPRAFVDELLTRLDIVEVIDSSIPLKKAGTSFVACCPFHQEKNPSFNVIPKKQFYYCFGCGASGNAISFVMNYMHQSFTDAVETLAARLGVQVPREGKLLQNKSSPNLYQLLSHIAVFYQQVLKNSAPEAVHYLKQRGVSGEIAKIYQLGFAPAGWQTLEIQFKTHREALLATGMLIKKDDGKSYDRYRQRIIFPIHDHRGRIIGFGGRSIDANQKPKYLNSPETSIFQKSRELYGLHQMQQHGTAIPYIIVVEGYLDVIALAQHGIFYSAATLGTATSTYHIQLLLKYTQKVIFCFDGDEAGKKAAWRALESCLPHLNTALDAQFIFLPEQHDPDSFIRSEGKARFQVLLDTAQPLQHYFFKTLMQSIDVTTLNGKTQLFNLAQPFIQRMPEGVYKQWFLDELSRLTHVDAHRVHQMVADAAKPQMIKAVQRVIKRTPIRVAMALLIQHPERLMNSLTKININQLQGPKQRLLQTLIQHALRIPTINTALMIEAFRDTPYFDVLNQLAAWPHQVPLEALNQEFEDIIYFLVKQNVDSEIQDLLKKARQSHLSDQERDVLQTLLKQRHTTH